MFKKLLYGIVAMTALFHSLSSRAQTVFHPHDSLKVHCGLSPEYIATLGVIPDNPNIPSGFPSSAIEYCGKFAVYYFDKAYHPGEGFDDATVGVTRRNTICAVLNYVQSVYDFSNIPNGHYIRLRVDTSYTHTYPTPYKNVLGFGAPFYKKPLVKGSIVNGLVHDYMKSSTGTDPMPGSFHADIQLNFDSILSGMRYTPYVWPNSVMIVPVEFQNGLGTVANCNHDLFSTALHLVGHGLGIWSWRDVIHGGTWTDTVYTSIDTAQRIAADPYTDPTAFTSPLVPAYTSGWLYFYGWLDNSPAPYRSSMDVICHFEDSYYKARVNSGDYQSHVMRFDFSEGTMVRAFSKEELKVGQSILGYNFNSSGFASSSTTAANYYNHRPYCNKNYNFRYNYGYFSEYYYFDTMAANYTVINNIGSSISINIWDDTSLHDDDGDTIRYIPESLVNIRGCGEGGNNHKLLSLSNGNRTITFSPRHNFYGRAQIGVNITDGKEKGAFVIYTIDCAKGNNVSVSYGENLVLNGDFEEGTEVKVKDSFELVNNTSFSTEFNHFRWSTRIKGGMNFSDCHPYSNGVSIRNSYVQCSETKKVTYTFGSPYTSFPWVWDSIRYYGYPFSIKYPDAYLSKGNRYQNSFFPNLFNLGDSVKKCHNYVLEFDAVRTITDSGFYYPGIDTLRIGFTTTNYLNNITPYDAHKIISLPPITFPKMDLKVWKHYSIPITYCSDSAANVLYLQLASGMFTGKGFATIYPEIWHFPSFIMDNVSLKEQSFTASIKDSAISPCITRLTAIAGSYNTCGTGLTYSWKALSTGKIIATTDVVDVSPALNTDYELTISNGCTSAKDTIRVLGSNCPCSPAKVFGDTLGFYSLSGTVSSIPPHSFYYVSANLTISNNSQFKDANVLIAPNVTIKVADSVLLTLDSAHLFTCPSDTFMWRGIVLQSGVSKSGRILVKNNCLIEDALFAIDAITLRTPASGDVINVSNSTFNRNQVDISMNGYKVSSPAVLPISIKGNLFTARLFSAATMLGYPKTWTSTAVLKAKTSVTDSKPPYFISKSAFLTKAKCKDSNIFSYLGIRTNNMGQTSSTGVYQSEVKIGEGAAVDDYNLFDNHQFGLVSYNSNISAYHNHFINISRRMIPSLSTTAPVSNGMAMILQSDKTVDTRAQVLPSSFGNLTNKFHDCFMGIYTENVATLNISSTNITKSDTAGGVVAGAAYTWETYTGYGMMLHNEGINKSNTISTNTISNVNVGIHLALLNPKPGAVTTINNNSLNAQNPDAAYALYVGKQYLSYGMNIYSSSGVLSTDNVANITYNTFNKVFNGIMINGLKNTKCSTTNNTFILWDTLTPVTSIEQYGIKAVSTNEATISGNTLSNFTATSTADRVRGIMAGTNLQLRICGNTTTNIGRGFEFAKGAAQTGTRWIDNTMNGGTKGMVLASEIGDQGLTYNWISISPRYFWWATKNKWNVTGGGSYQTYVDATTKSSLSKLYVRNITTGYVELPSNNDAFLYGNRYLFSGTTGSLLTVQQESNCLGAAYPQKYNPIPISGGTKTIGLMIISDSLGYDSTYKVRQWMNQLSLYELGTVDPVLRDSSKALDSFMTAAANSRFAWITNVEKAINAENLSLAQTLLNNTPQALGRVVLNGDLIITDYSDANHIVTNYSNYYTAYLHYLQGSMTASDSTAIQSIADKCPVKDGAVVYKARTLYQYINKLHKAYYDEECDLNQGNNYRKTQNLVNALANEYSLYPNPNNGVFSIAQSVVEDKTVSLKLYNALGQEIAQEKVTFKQGIANFKVQNASVGLYLICITEENNKTTCLKFNIQ